MRSTGASNAYSTRSSIRIFLSNFLLDLHAFFKRKFSSSSDLLGRDIHCVIVGCLSIISLLLLVQLLYHEPYELHEGCHKLPKVGWLFFCHVLELFLQLINFPLQHLNFPGAKFTVTGTRIGCSCCIVSGERPCFNCLNSRDT
jgi:hypothetical protein